LRPCWTARRGRPARWLVQRDGRVREG